jgi:large subunit ribosomal protein L18e
MAVSGPTNPRLRNLIEKLKSSESELWKRVAKDLARARRKRREVNLSRINRYSKEGEVIVVPGKVLGSGEIEHAITIAAFSFSKEAKQRITKAGGKVMSIEKLFKENPKGREIKLVG